MLAAAVEVDAGQAAKRGKVKVADEEGQRTPPRELVAFARKHRQPTPDHPPYCWMIGEAIDALAENGGSSEDSISAFICARYPGVPPAHDTLLRHYLGKHVAEGFFVRTAAGRYELVRGENADEKQKLLVEQAEAGSCCKPASAGSPVVEVKRGRGRGRPPSTPPASRKGGRTAGAQRTTPPAGSSSALVVAAAAKDSVAMSPVAVADKDEIQALSLKPKRRRRISGLETDSSGEALVAGKKDGSEVPNTLDKEHEPPRELAPVILGDSSAASAMDKACTEVPLPTTPPVDGGQPLDLALVTTTEVPVPVPVPAVPVPMPGSPPTTPPVDGGQPLELAPVTTTEVPVPVPVPMPAMDKDGGDVSPIMDKNAPMPAIVKGNGDVSSIVDKSDSICTTPTAPEPSSRACKLAIMAAADGPVPLLVADKKDGLKETPSATYKDVRQPRKAGSAPTAGKKVGGKALSATPKGRRRQRKSAPVIAGGCPTLASVTDQGSREASAMLKQHDQPRKLYPVTAYEISDDPGTVLIALAALNV